MSLAVALLLPAVGYPASSNDFVRRLDELTDDGDTTPAAAVTAIEALLTAGGVSPDQRRAALFAEGVILARNGDPTGARGRAARLIASGSEQPLAAADATLIEAEFHNVDDRPDLVFGEAQQVAAAYQARCGAAMPASCDYRNWYRALDLLQTAAQKLGNLGLATTKADLMRDIASKYGDRPREAMALAIIGVVAQRNGEPEVAADRLDQAHKVADESGSSLAIVRVTVLDALRHFFRHDNSDARTLYEQALSVADHANLPRPAMLIRANLGDAYLGLKQPKRALAIMAPALALAQERNIVNVKRLLLHNTTLAEIALGDKRYHADLRTVLELWARNGPTSQRVAAFQELSAALLAAGDSDEALELFRQEQQLVFAGGPDHDLLGRALAQEQAEMQRRQSERRRWWTAASIAILVLAGTALASLALRRRNLHLIERNDTLRRIAHVDALTGLSNRNDLSKLTTTAGKFSDGALYLVDLDHFKRINDELGHAAGDAVLVAVAQRLKSMTRDGDMVARWGGEEFLIFVPSTAGMDASAMAHRLLTVVAGTPIEWQGQAITVSASIGYAQFPLGQGQMRLLSEQAFAIVDAAMYQSKSQGRNRATGVEHIDAAMAGDPIQVAQDFASLVQEGRIHVRTVPGPDAIYVAAIQQRQVPATASAPVPQAR